MKNFWQNSDSQYLLNPRLSDRDKVKIEKAIEDNQIKDCVWLQSSGTESSLTGIKMVGLEKKAILHAAESVNNHFQVNNKDIWLNPLPIFHIGGLSISARCFLSGAHEIAISNWVAQDFFKIGQENKVTITSLVPTQIYDLVNQGLKAFDSLRLVIVGGGAVSDELYQAAIELGWPLVLSYGMTETAALIAASNLNQEKPKLKLLEHVQLLLIDGRWIIESQSLFKGYLLIGYNGDVVWQKRLEPFIVDDRIEFNGGQLKILGRESELVKILGETVNIRSLEEKIYNILKKPVAIISKPETRKGYDLYLYVESDGEVLNLKDINQQVMPFERFKEMKTISSFSRTALGKIIKNQF